MALGLVTESGGGGSNIPVLKYDARAGRMFRVDRAQDANGNWAGNQVEVTSGFQAVMDLENVQVGWALFASGVAPDFAFVPLGQPLPARPSVNYKQGFRIMLKLGKSAGGDVREFVHTAKVVIGAMDALHTEFEKGRTSNPGKLPIVAMTGSTAVTFGGGAKSSTNYAPTFAITGWVDRPAELPAGGPPPVSPPPANEGRQQPVVQAVTTAQAAPAADPLAEEF
jgi:hypothetical protein